jgi:hypothetical protein
MKIRILVQLQKKKMREMLGKEDHQNMLMSERVPKI